VDTVQLKPADVAGVRVDGRNESPAQRADRNLQELLNELRVALPGVQVLFAFLLVVPFSQRFVDVSAFQEKVYFTVLLLTAVATALLIAPTALHRLMFGLRLKDVIVADSNRLAIAGLVTLSLAMTGAVLLITDVLFSALTSALTTAAIGALFGALWLGLPLYRRASAPRRPPDNGHRAND
jgi:hypothetical protein